MDGPFISDLLPINNAVIQQQKKSLYLAGSLQPALRKQPIQVTPST
ncbi:hypothetical protein C427_2279 [Paraglaciecola psychrophila 170]|uniref:Uncharacterized protein n=1 Tax=Paraglaciecola psychrophila 170 TaxID=1129794 RepID=K6ZPR9_9ALTE|nr:hypothetical protein C427_2279 [Paraglaciecola psychrophila 170]GAC37946.1 hypothetical protein GPSY_2325 [Paraglaciecola psychrophila 170]